jgi:glycosyltransferase involved in cell wall biosynthesis
VSEPRTLHLLLERLTRGLVDRYVCVSPAVAAFARARLHVPQARLRVITNGVHPVPDAPEQPRPPRRPVHGLTIGRLTRQKGVDVLLRALARLPRSLDWTWSVVGPEPEPRYAIQMKQLATELGLGQRVRWLGPVPRERTAGLYAEADVFVLASRWEGQPNVVLEAFAHTLPVVATAVDGTADLDNEAPGCLEPVPPEDPAALADAIARVATDASLRRRRAMLGRQLVARRSWNRVTDAYEQLYTELTTQATASPSPG